VEGLKEAMQVATAVDQDPERLEATALEGLKVQFISLVPNPANKRHFLVMKCASLGEGFEVVEKQIAIVRKDAARQMIYGVVLAPNEVDDELDTITEAEIEKSAYAFMQGGRTQQIDTDHSTDAGAGFVAESWIVRAGDPLFAEETLGTWVVGVKVTDEAAWDRIEKEDLLGFSTLAGYADAEGDSGGVRRDIFVVAQSDHAGGTGHLDGGG
jgi:hypothetical protein